MKKKLLIGLLTIIICLVLSGCGEENNFSNNSNNNANSNQTNENKSTNNSNNTSDYIIVDDKIIESDNEDNATMDEGKVIVKEIINCDGCVFAYFDKEGEAAVRLGSTLSSDEYTTDINNLKTKGKNQRHNFFGLVLSGNTISKAYACILKDSKIYCIQGSTDGAYHTNNIGILNQIFTADQCKTISDGHTYTCTDGHYNGDTRTTGFTSLHYETSCTIYGSQSNTGKLICH